MRVYNGEREETLRARRFLVEWADDNLLTKEQYHRLEHGTPSDLRTTNVFLRLVLFLFAIIGTVAVLGLFFLIFLSRPSEQTAGVFFLIFAAVAYTAAELSVSWARLYRHGIEEAFAVCSAAFLCIGLVLFLFHGVSWSAHAAESTAVAAGAGASLWVWYRFNLLYAFPAAMIFAAFLPTYLTQSEWSHHVLTAAFYAVGLICSPTFNLSHTHAQDLFCSIVSKGELQSGLRRRSLAGLVPDREPAKPLCA